MTTKQERKPKPCSCRDRIICPICGLCERCGKEIKKP